MTPAVPPGGGGGDRGRGEYHHPAGLDSDQLPEDHSDAAAVVAVRFLRDRLHHFADKFVSPTYQF